MEDTHEAYVRYYDGDYPAEVNTVYPENFDETTEYQGVRHDVERYVEIARKTGGHVLELCCGTGRVAIPLAREGSFVTAVDISQGMLDRLKANLARESEETRSRIETFRQDVTRLSLARRDYPLAIIAFNSLLTIPDFELQCAALQRASEHVVDGGTLVLDIVNPLQLRLEGDPVPKPFFRRRQTDSGNFYTRFAMMTALDAEQRQRLHGWYDEEGPDSLVTRTPYSLLWRPIFRYELTLMLRNAGFDLVSLEGGHRREPFEAGSSWMFVQALRTPSS